MTTRNYALKTDIRVGLSIYGKHVRPLSSSNKKQLINHCLVTQFILYFLDNVCILLSLIIHKPLLLNVAK